MDAKERGKKILEDALADPKCPAEKKTLYQQLLTDDYMIEFVGTHGLRQDEFSRNMATAQEKWAKAEQWNKDLGSWKTSVDAEIEDGKKAKGRLAELEASGGGRILNPDGTTKSDGPDLSKFVPREEVDRKVNEAVNYATNYGGYITRLGLQHLKEFDEVLDTDKLLAFCRERSLPLDRGGYEAFVGEKRAERQKIVNENALKEAERKGYERALSEGSSSPPYPVSTGGDDQTLSGLDPANKGKFGVAAAVQTYNSEIRKKLGVGGA